MECIRRHRARVVCHEARGNATHVGQEGLGMIHMRNVIPWIAGPAFVGAMHASCFAMLDVAAYRGWQRTATRQSQQLACVALTLGGTPIRLGEAQSDERSAAAYSRLEAIHRNTPPLGIGWRKMKELIRPSHVADSDICHRREWAHPLMATQGIVKVARLCWHELIDQPFSAGGDCLRVKPSPCPDASLRA